MVPGYDCAASVLLCAEDNASILGLDEEGEESSWAAATPPRDTIAAAADGGGWIAADGNMVFLHSNVVPPAAAAATTPAALNLDSVSVLYYGTLLPHPLKAVITDFLLSPSRANNISRSTTASAPTPSRVEAVEAAAAMKRLDLFSGSCQSTPAQNFFPPAEGYPQKLQRRYGDLDLAALRRDAVDRIWKVTEHYNFAPLTAVLSVNYLYRFLSTFELPVLEKNFVFEGRTLKRMELLVLGTLKWRMHAVTACSFIEYFLHKLSDLGAPSLLARSRSSDLILNTAKGAEFAVFRPSEIAASVALAAMGECRSSVIERAAASCKYLNKERVLRCHEMIQEKIAMGSIVLKSAGSSISSVPQSPIGVLDAATCLSQQSDDATAGSPATCCHSSSTSKRRRITRRLL
nr:unnamed protein product [Digitaria exilis]